MNESFLENALCPVCFCFQTVNRISLTCTAESMDLASLRKISDQTSRRTTMHRPIGSSADTCGDEAKRLAVNSTLDSRRLNKSMYMFVTKKNYVKPISNF